MSGVLLLFLDGVGIGSSDPDVNPFFRASLPALSSALGGSLPSEESPSVAGPLGKAFPIDACLGVEGTPQSGTGQVALLTGRNAPELLGRHFGPWPPVRLRPLLETESLFRRALDGGARVTFANAHPPGYPAGADPRRVAAFTVAAAAAGLLDKDHEALARGEAIASEILNETWRKHIPSSRIPSVTPEQAGVNLARLAEGYDLTVFAHYQTDIVGHRGGMRGAVCALERVDGFLDGLLGEIRADSLVLVVSDHGNLEDVRGGHTRNPALGLALGRAASAFAPPPSLTSVADAVLGEMELEP